MKNISPKFVNWSKHFTKLGNLHGFKTMMKLHVKKNKIAHILNEIKGMFNIIKGHLEIYVGLHITRDMFTKTIHIHHQ
jgi:RNA-binding protein YlmH